MAYNDSDSHFLSNSFTIDNETHSIIIQSLRFYNTSNVYKRFIVFEFDSHDIPITQKFLLNITYKYVGKGNITSMLFFYTHTEWSLLTAFSDLHESNASLTRDIDLSQSLKLNKIIVMVAFLDEKNLPENGDYFEIKVKLSFEKVVVSRDFLINVYAIFFVILNTAIFMLIPKINEHNNSNNNAIYKGKGGD